MILELMAALHFTVPLGAADAFSMEQYVSYKNETKGFEIEYPADWKQQTKEGFDLVVASPNEEASVSILSGPLGGEMNTDKYYTLNVKNLLDASPSIEIKDNCKMQMDGISTYWLRYTRMEQSLVDITQYLFVMNKLGFVITAATGAIDYPTYKDTFSKILKSFRKVEPKAKKR